MLIRFDYVLDSNYTKVFQAIVLMMNESMDEYVFSKPIYMYKKGFSMDLIKMSLKMLGQKSIKSCYVPLRAQNP